MSPRTKIVLAAAFLALMIIFALAVLYADGGSGGGVGGY
jgi:hypothetical protein